MEEITFMVLKRQTQREEKLETGRQEQTDVNKITTKKKFGAYMNSTRNLCCKYRKENMNKYLKTYIYWPLI